MGKRAIVLKNFIFPFIFISFLSACDKGSPGLISDLSEIEKFDDRFSKAESKISELKGFISKEQDKSLKVINSSYNKSRFYRMLGLQYLALEMYGEAYQAFTNARLISPKNALIAYYQGVSAANVAKNMPLESDERQKYISFARDAYHSSLKFKSDFKEVLYALSVLYGYELKDLDQAFFYINRLLSLDSQNAKAWIMKGNLSAALGKRDEALLAYQKAKEQVVDNDDRAVIDSLIQSLST